MIAVVIINYRTATDTLACLHALLPELRDGARVFVLDNASGSDDADRLQEFAVEHSAQVDFQRSDLNLGFAAGMNMLLKKVLSDPAIDRVLALNSDTIPTSGFLDRMERSLDPETQTDMVAARLLRRNSEAVDSLGITLYRCTLASNRKSEDEILLGPTGGCALFTRRLLEDLRASFGEWFDEAFFCYAEDTDMVLRARWLGYLPAYCHDAKVYHVGALSAGGRESDFVLYHGIRNSIWWLAKNAPSGWLLRSLPWFVVLHVGIWLRHLRRGRIRVLWRLYRDAFKGLRPMLAKRRTIAQARRVPVSEFSKWIEPRFYSPGYMRRAWRELFGLSTLPRDSGV